MRARPCASAPVTPFASSGSEAVTTVVEPSEASRRDLERAGYRQCGLYRRHFLVDGQWHDTCGSGDLRDDWEAQEGRAWKLPQRVTLCEVGTRDGFQIEPDWIPTDLKVEVVDRLSATGVPRIEVTSFVSPKAIPALRDAEEVMARIQRRPGTRFSALVPNDKGAVRAVDARRGRDPHRAVGQREPQPRQREHVHRGVAGEAARHHGGGRTGRGSPCYSGISTLLRLPLRDATCRWRASRTW